jgi:glycosyltransferase involved in cell wall biosynthesis
LEQLARELGIDQVVQLPGNSAVPGGWLEGADIFVLPSRYEGFPNALCEAMASGKAVIAADCRYGPREIIRDRIDGILVPPADPIALCGALQELMHAEDRRTELGYTARSVADRYAEPVVFKRWDDLVVRLAHLSAA